MMRCAATAALCVFGLMAAAQSTEKPEGIIREASTLLRNTAGEVMPVELRDAFCIAVILGRTPAEVRESGRPGVVSCRSPRGWSQPVIVTAKTEEGGDADSESLILGTMDLDGALKLRAGNLDLAHHDNVRVYAVVQTKNIGLLMGGLHKAQPVLHQRSQVPLVLEKDDAANHAVYGDTSSYEAVITGEAGGSKAGEEFTAQLQKDIAIPGGEKTGGGGGGAVASVPPPPPPPPPPPRRPPESRPVSNSGSKPGSRPGSTSTTTGSSKGNTGTGGGVKTSGGSRIASSGYGETVTVTRRVTGIAFVPPVVEALGGYGLYSYVLIDHRPSDEERGRFRAFFVAMLARPTAKSLAAAGVPVSRINVTELLVNTAPDEDELEKLTAEEQSDWAIDHYDYGRSAAILACLPKDTGRGPVIVSVLEPVDVTKTPHPVLTLDLSSAEPAVMSSYVDYFVTQASRDRFWDERALEMMSLELRNLMEVAASGLGLSREAVQSWLKLAR